MFKTVRFEKAKWFPRPHDFTHSFLMGLETGVDNHSTIYPIIMHDEGLGAVASYKANPENASFVTASEPNCYPESRINKDGFSALARFSLTKDALETDKLHAVRFAYMPIFTAFKENLIAIDELTSLETQDILSLTSESTDRQCYPLWNGIDLVEADAGNNTGKLPTNVPGLTTNQVIEGVAFAPSPFYDAIHYLTIAGKLKSMCGGLKWITLTKTKPYFNLKIQLRSDVKRINPYTFFGCLIHLPNGGTEQYHMTGDTTNINHLRCDFQIRFNEWNENFFMQKV